MAAFPGGVPVRQPLDAVLPDRPAFLPEDIPRFAALGATAIVDADLATIKPGEIGQASVRQTWVRGQVAYESPEER